MRTGLRNTSTRTGAKKIPSVFCFGALLTFLIVFAGCSDFLEPVDSTPTPSEYEFNYWLLDRTYLFREELPKLKKDGDSVQTLYNDLDDPYTRYVPPSKSEQATTSLNTSIVPGDLGMEYMTSQAAVYPIFIYRVYPNGPAGRANVPRYGNIRAINGTELTGDDALYTYQNILSTSQTVDLTVHYDTTDYHFKLTKENVYAPTVFIDTLYGVTFITITEFKLNTADKVNGTLGEVRAYLDSTRHVKEPRVIDIRNNPGGHVSQCVGIADLFVKEGTLSTRHWRAFNADGTASFKTAHTKAHGGDAGEEGKFLILQNKRSASCAEIFASSVTELADIPIAGMISYGKGIGQTNWNTVAGGLAIITNLEFITPKGNSYHRLGVKPDYPCGTTPAVYCAVQAVDDHFGSHFSETLPSLSKESAQDFSTEDFKPVPRHVEFGGAYLFEDETF